MRSLILLIVLLFSLSLFAQQQNNRVKGRSVDAFPYPYTHFTFIQPRFDHQDQKYGDYLNSYVIRGTKTFQNFNHLRIELPFASTNVGHQVFGLSDIKARLLHSTPVYHHLYVAYGAELTLPTATDVHLGSGKWQGRPEVGIIHFIGTPDNIIGTVSFGVDYRFDFAGPSDRAKISVLGMAPNIDYWGKQWYVGYYATWTYDFESEILDIPLDFEVGYSLNAQWTLSAEYIQPLVSKRTYNNEYAIKLRYLFQ